jgi:tRNA(fMet)-specific endonuclease VapC
VCLGLDSHWQITTFLDAQIAAVAKSNNLILITRNTEDFKSFAELQLDNWFI